MFTYFLMDLMRAQTNLKAQLLRFTSVMFRLLLTFLLLLICVHVDAFAFISTGFKRASRFGKMAILSSSEMGEGEAGVKFSVGVWFPHEFSSSPLSMILLFYTSCILVILSVLVLVWCVVL